ncbi:MAG: D-aminoacylase [bacterium]|nr:MAG: D-aminoacylase [bacterium]
MSSKISRRKFIRNSSLATAGILFGCSVRPVFDVLIKNGQIADGLLARTFTGDIGIIGDKIAAIGNLGNASANLTIDALGKVVSPGFIDMHSHTDTELLIDPKADSKIHQGVTTEVSGNCGYAPFPLTDADQKESDQESFQQYGLHISWTDIDGFLKEMEKARLSLNYITLTGHGKLRGFVMGKNDLAPSTDQLTKMKEQLAHTLEAGSFGLSTGLEYAPGSYAKTDELIELSKIVAEYDGFYATHLRNEDDTVEEAVKEALQICREAQVSLQISHLKVCNKNNWHKIDHVLEMIHRASEEGHPVHADRYPYNAWSTGISSLLPLWSRQGNTDEIIARLDVPDLVPDIRSYAEERGSRIGGWDRLIINSCYSDENKIFEGKSIAECLEVTGLSPFEFIKKMMIEERGRVTITGFAMDEANLHKVLSSPLVMIGSDGSAVSPEGKLSHGKPHPRYYGTFPRVLGKYCREEKLFDIAVAVQKMSSMPADKLGLKYRGKLAKEYFADIVIFNPDTVIDKATFSNPHQFPIGIQYVLVNGKMVIKEGKHTGKYPGRVLRKTSSPV